MSSGGRLYPDRKSRARSWDYWFYEKFGSCGGPMLYAFPKPLTVDEAVRDTKRVIEAAVTKISQQQEQCRKDEKKQFAEIRKLGIGGDQRIIRAMISDIVASRNYVSYCQHTITQLNAVNRQLGMMGSTASLGSTAKVTAGLMVSLSHIVNVPELMHLKHVFQHQNQLFQVMQEKMEDMTSGMTQSMDKNKSMEYDVQHLEASILQALGEEFQAKFGNVNHSDEVDAYNAQIGYSNSSNNRGGGGPPPPPPGGSGGGGGGGSSRVHSSALNGNDNDIGSDDETDADFALRLENLKKPASITGKLGVSKTTSSRKTNNTEDQWEMANQ